MSWDEPLDAYVADIQIQYRAVGATAWTDGGSVDVHLSRSRGLVRISIKNTGIGIPEGDIVKLGRPFEQVENQFSKSHQGSGLGLAISRALVELHRGSLQIKSREGQGTTVTCTLPIKAVTDEEEDEDEAASA